MWLKSSPFISPDRANFITTTVLSYEEINYVANGLIKSIINRLPGAVYFF